MRRIAVDDDRYAKASRDGGAAPAVPHSAGAGASEALGCDPGGAGREEKKRDVDRISLANVAPQLVLLLLLTLEVALVVVVVLVRSRGWEVDDDDKEEEEEELKYRDKVLLWVEAAGRFRSPEDRSMSWYLARSGAASSSV